MKDCCGSKNWPIPFTVWVDVNHCGKGRTLTIAVMGRYGGGRGKSNFRVSCSHCRRDLEYCPWGRRCPLVAATLFLKNLMEDQSSCVWYCPRRPLFK